MYSKFFKVEQLKEDIQKVLQFLENFNQKLNTLPCQPDVKPGFLRNLLPNKAPVQGKQIEDILQNIDQQLVPGMTHWQHPNFFAYFPGEITHATLVGELISCQFNNPNFAWQVSPTATELENLIMDWIVDMLGLPQIFSFNNSQLGGGAIINSVSEGYFSSVNAAKYQKMKDLNQSDCFKLVAYYPDSSQFWSRKALFIKEIQHQRLLPLKFCEKRQNLTIDLNQFETQIQKDIEEGLIPFWCNASIGTTSSGASDDILGIGQICQKYKIFLNVDAAYKGTQWVCPELREETEGLVFVDSLQINFAKNMMMGMHGATVFVKDRQNWMESHGRNLQKNEIYKNYYDNYDIVDYKDWTVGFGKKFNSMKFYIVFNYFGIQGMQEFVRNKIELAIYFENQIKNSNFFEFPVKREIALVCFRLKQLEHKTREEMIELNRQFLIEVNKNEPQKGFISGTLIDNQYVLRFCSNNSTCKQENVDDFIKKLIECSQIITKQ